MEKGDDVYVCYDGKFGRRVAGKITQTRGCFIRVSFHSWGDVVPLPIECWFPRLKNGGYGAFVRVENSFMKSFLGFPGDWYSVFPKEIEDDFLEAPSNAQQQLEPDTGQAVAG